MAQASAPVTILADPTQIQQIVMNLCINAAHAMDDRGTISVAVDSDSADIASNDRLSRFMASKVPVGLPVGPSSSPRPAPGSA